MHRVLFSLFLLAVVVSCSQKEKKNVSETIKYPNQDAPLALLMREMFVDMEEIKVSVEEGKSIKQYLEKHKEILTARPTDISVKSEAFQTMGMAYLASLKQLENSKKEELRSNYQLLVNSCLACHNNFCPGPVKRINLLKID